METKNTFKKVNKYGNVFRQIIGITMGSGPAPFSHFFL